MKRFHHISILFTALLFFASTIAQKQPQYTQYMYNVGSINPAYVATVESLDIAALYRAQWIDISGAPRTIRLGANFPLENEKMGIGFNAVNEELGPISQTYIDGSYSYQIEVAQGTKLSFGINTGGSFLNVDYNKGNFENPNDIASGPAEQNNFYAIIGAGTFLYSDQWYLGVSIPNFLTNGIYNDEVATIVEDEIQYNFIGGYVLDLSERLKFKPAFLLNYLSGSPVNMNISANFLYQEMFTGGISYRFDNAVSALAGFQVSPGLFIGYSYDYNTNGLAQFNSGSHEAILKFYIGEGSSASKSRRQKRNLKGKPKRIDSPRFF